MAATLRYWLTIRRYDRTLLERVAAGLRGLPNDYPTTHCRYAAPIQGYAHAHQVMAAHAGHFCGRYTEAVRYAEAITK